jgi:hypothetical protein
MDVAPPITPDRGASPPQPAAPILAAPSSDATREAGVDQRQAAPKPRTVVRDVSEALREEDHDLFRHRKLDPFSEALLRDEDRGRFGERPAESMDFDTFCATISCKYGAALP